MGRLYGPFAVAVRRAGRTGLLFTDQGHQIRFETRAVLCGMAQQEFDQPTLAGAEMPVNASARQTMQEGNRLLGQEFFEFVGGHGVALSHRHSAIS
jgi:hypothetical protein